MRHGGIQFLFFKKLDSSTLEATGRDSLSDCIATSVVLAATLIAHFSRLNLDGIGGVFVSLFIFYSGISSAREAIDPLLGAKPEPEFVDRLKEMVLDFDKTYSVCMTLWCMIMDQDTG